MRVLAATNRTLQTELREKRFRDDLYYRLAGATIHIPSLQERTEDIPLLAEHFLRRFEKELDRPDLSLSRETLAVLVQRPWPGNAREIQNVLRLAVIRATGNVIHPEHLDPSPSSKRGARSGEGPRTLAEIEHQAMDDALHEADGNVTAAAKRLGVDRSTLWRKMKRRRDIVTNAKTGS